MKRAQNSKDVNNYSNLFDFHAWTTSGSTMACRRAASSSKSNNHLTAGGKASSAVRIVVKKSSTNFCIVPFVESNLKNIFFKIKNPSKEKNKKRELRGAPREEDLWNGLVCPLSRAGVVTGILMLVYRFD